MDSVPQRLAMYRRIASIRSESDAEDVLDELVDRYGEPPESVKGLISVSLIRNSAIKHNIHNIRQHDGKVLFFSNSFSSEKLLPLLKIMRGRIAVNTTGKQYFSVKIARGENMFDLIRLVLKLLNTDDE